MAITDEVRRTRTSTGRRAMVAITMVAVGMLTLALISCATALARFLTAQAMTAESIRLGVELPAAAFDGVSPGTWSYDQISISQMYAGNEEPTGEAIAFARSLREISAPFHAAEAINALIVVALATVVLLLCLRLLRGLPFVRHMTVSLGIFAAIVFVGSIAGQAIRRLPFADPLPGDVSFRSDVAYWIAMGKVGMNDEPHVPQYVDATTAIPFDLTLVGIAVLLALLAAAFAIGERMQRDSQGLV